MIKYSKQIYLSGQTTETPGTSAETQEKSVDQKLENLANRRTKRIEARKKEIEKSDVYKKNQEELVKLWMEQKLPEGTKIPEENYMYELLWRFGQTPDAKEAFILLRLVEKYWTKEEARKLFIESTANFQLNSAMIRQFFTMKKCRDKLGFYYFFSADKKNWKTGWYVRKTEKNENDIYCNNDSLPATLSTILSKIQPEAVEKAGNLDINQILSASGKEVQQIDKTKIREELFTWFSSPDNKDKWVVLPDEQLAKFTLIYGKNKNIYRYRLIHDRVFATIIPGQTLPEGFTETAFIDIRNNSLDEKMWFFDKKHFAEKMNNKLTPKRVAEELENIQIESGQKEVTKDIALYKTEGLVSKLKDLPANIEFSNLESGYLDVVRSKLTEELKKDEKLKNNAEKIAGFRTDDLKEDILEAIKSNGDLKLATGMEKSEKDADKDVKISINVKSDDSVTVDFANDADKNKYKELSDKKKEAETGIDAAVNRKYDEFKQRLVNIFGNKAVVFLGIFDSIFKIKDGLKEVAEGKKTSIAPVVLGWFGISVTKRSMLSYGMNSEEFHKLLDENQNEYVLTKDILLTKNYKLVDREIIIPKGAGIEPGGEMMVRFDNNSTAIPIDKPKQEKTNPIEQGKKAVFGMFGSGSQEKDMFTNNMITLDPQNTKEIPAGTHLPKGAKIKKINK